MCRELYIEVIRLMKAPSSYIRQRAALAAIRTIKNIPDVIEDFHDVIKMCINDKHQSVVMATVTLCCDICKIDEKTSYFSKFIVKTTIQSLISFIHN